MSNSLDFVRKTPLIFAPPLNCWLKLECLQATGSFKLRGAALKLSRMAPSVTEVVAASAGNHGLGVALSAGRLGIRATVVVPTITPAVKRDGIARLGAQVIVAGAGYDEAEAHAKALAAARALPFISPYDDDDVIEGNGSWLAREIQSQHAGLRRVVVPVGGGGLMAGLARALDDSVEIVGVQPRVNCAMHDSLELGRALTTYHGGATLCEGLEGATGERTFAVAQARGLRIALVEEQEVLAAIGFAWRALGITMEASSAVVVAAARRGSVAVDEETVMVISGGNIEGELLDQAIVAAGG